MDQAKNTREFSEEFLNNQGKGREKGSKNKATIAREEGIAEGRAQILRQLRRSEGNSNKRGDSFNKDLVGKLVQGVEFLDKLPGSKWVGGILALWNAEKFIDGFPQLLHSIAKLLDLAGAALGGMEGMEEYTEAIFSELAEEIQDITILNSSHTFQPFRDGQYGNPIVIKSFTTWVNKKTHVNLLGKQLNELIDEWIKPSGLAMWSGKVDRKLRKVMDNPWIPVTQQTVDTFNEIYLLSKYSNPLRVRGVVL